MFDVYKADEIWLINGKEFVAYEQLSTFKMR